MTLQKNLYTLSTCHRDMNRLLIEAADGEINNKSEWYNHSLGDTYIGKNSRNLENLHWISGVDKIQKNNIEDMTMDKMVACKS